MGNGKIFNVSPAALATDKGDVGIFERDVRNAFSFIERHHKQKHSFHTLRSGLGFSGKRTDEVIKALKALGAIKMVSSAEFRFVHDPERAARAIELSHEEKRDPAVAVATDYRVEHSARVLYESIITREEEPVAEAIVTTAPAPQRVHGEIKELILLYVEENPGSTSKQIAQALAYGHGTTAATLSKLVTAQKVYTRGERGHFAYYPMATAVERAQAADADIRAEAEALVAKAQEKAMADELVKQAERKQRIRKMAEQMARERGIDVKYLIED